MGSNGSLNQGSSTAHPPGYHHPRNYSSLAQLYVRKSSSPARQGPTGGSGGSRGVARYGKGARGGLSTLPRPLNHRGVGGEFRRSSAAGLNVVSQRPPLPPKIELRSHSYDGLLDDSTPGGSGGQQRRRVGAAMASASMATEGRDRVDGVGAAAASKGGCQEDSIKQQHQQQLGSARKVFKEPATPGTAGASAGGETIKSKNRRSRSMDDLFDDDVGQGAECTFLDNTQSMETLLGSDHRHEATPSADPTPPESPGSAEAPVEVVRSMGGNICFNRRFVHDEPEPATGEGDREGKDEHTQDSLTTSHEQLCENETITVDSTPRLAEHEHDEDEHEHEEDVQSTHSSAASSHGSGASAGPKKAPKPLINRYVKKVKSFMKI